MHLRTVILQLTIGLVILYGKKYTKFKLRTGKRLITYKAEGDKNYQKILSLIPPTLPKVEINKKESKKKGKK